MRPAGIQDESSEHEHQKAYKRPRTHTASAETGNITRVTTSAVLWDLVSGWARSNAMTGEPLSDAIVEKVTDLIKRLSLAVLSYRKCIRAAEYSQYCIKGLCETFITLVSWTGFLKECISNNKHDDITVELLDSINELLDAASAEIIAMRLKLNIECGEFDESEWSLV